MYSRPGWASLKDLRMDSPECQPNKIESPRNSSMRKIGQQKERFRRYSCPRVSRPIRFDIGHEPGCSPAVGLRYSQILSLPTRVLPGRRPGDKHLSRVRIKQEVVDPYACVAN